MYIFIILVIFIFICIYFICKKIEYFPINYTPCQNECGYILDVDEEELTDEKLNTYWSCYNDCMTQNYKEDKTPTKLSPCAELAESYKNNIISLQDFCNKMIWLGCSSSTYQLAGNPVCKTY
jgi:hypothetical protein